MTGTDVVIMMALMVGAIFAIGLGMRYLGDSLDKDD